MNPNGISDGIPVLEAQAHPHLLKHPGRTEAIGIGGGQENLQVHLQNGFSEECVPRNDG